MNEKDQQVINDIKDRLDKITFINHEQRDELIFETKSMIGTLVGTLEAEDAVQSAYKQAMKERKLTHPEFEEHYDFIKNRTYEILFNKKLDDEE